MRIKFVLCWSFILVLAAACGNQDRTVIPETGVYQPPTVVEDAPLLLTPQITETVSFSEDVFPTATLSCTNNLLFLSDLSIPDGTLVQAGQQLDKRWLIRNNGTCNWNDRYQVRLIAGLGMGVPVEQSLYPALSGTDVTIRMMFIAPEEPGNHRSAWQAYDPQGEPFGDPFFIDIIVGEE